MNIRYYSRSFTSYLLPKFSRLPFTIVLISLTVYLILLHTPSFLLEIRVIIKISKNPWYPINCDYRIVASTNTCYYSENQLFVKRSQYIRTKNPLHKQSEKAKTSTRDYTV